MKKLSTTLILIMSVLLTFGQMYPSNLVGKKELNSDFPNLRFNNIHNSQLKSMNSRWINYSESVEYFLEMEFTLSANNLFPDTNIKVLYSGGEVAGPWIHGLADVVDISSFYWDDETNFSGEMLLNAGSTYKVDSIQLLAWYSRNISDPNIVDTLQIDILINNSDSYNAYYFSGATTLQNFGSDSVFFVSVPYNQPTNEFAATGKVTFKFPLTAAMALDTLDNGLTNLQFPISLPNSTFKLFTATYKFIPGYQYSWADTLSSMNSFRFLSWEEIEGDFPDSYNKADYNCSYILPTDVRYNQADSWNGEFIPSFAYTAPYSYEHHWIYYHVVGVSDFGYVSVQEMSKNNSLSVYPNPSNSKVTVELNSNDLSIVGLYNLVGQNVLEVSTNNNSIDLNVSDLKAGVYMLKVTQGSKVYTSKLIVK